MNLEELKVKLHDVVNHNVCGVEFYFILKRSESEDVIKKVDIDEQAQQELKRNFIDSINGLIVNNADLSLLELSGADDRVNAIYHYDIEEVPTQLASLERVISCDRYEYFNFHNDNLRDLRGMVILIGYEQNQIALYKHHYPISLYQRDSGLFLRSFGQNARRMVKLDRDILRITSGFEFIRSDDEYYIVNLKVLEKFCGFHDVVKRVASQGIDVISQSHLVENVEPLVNRLDDISFSRKLVKVSRSSPVLNVIPNHSIIGFVQNHPRLSRKIRLTEDGTKIKIDTNVSMNLFLQLLNDDFLQSELTSLYYSSIAKDKIE